MDIHISPHPNDEKEKLLRSVIAGQDQTIALQARRLQYYEEEVRQMQRIVRLLETVQARDKERLDELWERLMTAEQRMSDIEATTGAGS